MCKFCIFVACTEANAEWWPTVLAFDKEHVKPQPTSSTATNWVCGDAVKKITAIKTFHV